MDRGHSSGIILENVEVSDAGRWSAGMANSAVPEFAVPIGSMSRSSAFLGVEGLRDNYQSDC